MIKRCTSIEPPDVDLHTAVGLAGVVAYVVSYAALQLGFLDGNGASYSAANVVAASLVLFSLTSDFNLASAVTQVIWIVIGVSGLLLRVVRHGRKSVGTEIGTDIANETGSEIAPEIDSGTGTRRVTGARPGKVRATLDLLPDSARETGRPTWGLQADIRRQ